MTPLFFTDSVKAAIADHADKYPTEEVCGLILDDHTVVCADNIVDDSGFVDEGGTPFDRTTASLISDDLIHEYEDRIVAVYHSHPSETQEGWLSFKDIDESRFHQIPYVLYHTQFKTWDLFDPYQYHPYPLKEKGSPKRLDYYKGWPFEFGRADCATLMRCYFYNILNHSIPDYPRPHYGDWYKQPGFENAYLELMQDPVNGFVQVNTSTPKKHDVVLMRFFGSITPCHVGIMVESDQMLHILEPGHLSEITTWGGAWKRGLHSVWRLAK